jgi:REP element-mobilizing transposase RayT
MENRDPIGRKPLPHDPPLGIDTSREVFFITICAANRDSASLVQPGISDILLEAVRHRHAAGVWYARLFLVMPDHVHGLLSFPHDASMRRAVADWKRWTATKGRFRWQPDFFAHRLRSSESAREKADYILENPVRAGLVSGAEDWPHRWIAPDPWW